MSLIPRFSSLVYSVLGKAKKTKDGSVAINDKSVIQAFINHPDNTFLVSFPRTGSHWLRMMVELYFGRPSLVRVFYYPERKNYLMMHTHDLELDVERANVIYLYRDPVDTIHSQLRYYCEGTDDESRIRYWADLYGRHLDKWIHSERFTTHKTVITYEGMKGNLAREFKKLTTHFHQPFDRTKLDAVAEKVSKNELKRLVAPEYPQVVQTEFSYEFSREKFREEMSETVWEAVLAGRPDLQRYFTQLQGEHP